MIYEYRSFFNSRVAAVSITVNINSLMGRFGVIRITPPLKYCSLLAVAIIVLAWFSPLPNTNSELSTPNDLMGSQSRIIDEELANSLLSLRRWGGGGNAANGSAEGVGRFADIVFHGFIAKSSGNVALVQLPSGNLLHVQIGDTLPDGRKVLEISDVLMLQKIEASAEPELDKIYLFPNVKSDSPVNTLPKTEPYQTE